MANYRNISINFWTDSKVDDEFTPEDKYFYLYLLTNPHTSLCGCYEISMKQMERETGYNTDTIKRLIDRMEKIHKVIRFDPETKEVLILNWYKFNWSKSDKVRSAIATATKFVKSESFRKYVIDRVYIVYGYRIDTVSIPNPPDTDTDTDTDADTEGETVDTVSIGYKYPIDTVSETEAEKTPSPHIDKLVKTFGKETVDKYIDKVMKYYKEHNKTVNVLEKVEQWLTEDEAKGKITRISHPDAYAFAVNRF